MQTARYRIDRILAGRIAAREVLVTHSACAGDVFRAVAVGECVRIEARRNESGTDLSESAALELGYKSRRRPERSRYFAADPPVAVGDWTLLRPRPAAQLAVAPEPAHRRVRASDGERARAR